MDDNDNDDGAYIAQYPGCLARSVRFTVLPQAMGLCIFDSTISTPVGIRNRAAANSAIRLHIHITICAGKVRITTGWGEAIEVK